MAKHDFTLDDLRMPIKWLGDSIGLDDAPTIRLSDATGGLFDTSPEELLEHPAWEHLDAYGRVRIERSLKVAGMTSELLGAA